MTDRTTDRPQMEQTSDNSASGGECGDSLRSLLDGPRVLVHARGFMTPDECDFWQRTRAALRERGVELFLIGYQAPRTEVMVPFVRINNSLGRTHVKPADYAWRRWLTPLEDFDRGRLLEREDLWYGPAAGPAQVKQRTDALWFLRDFYAAALMQVRPALTVIWNGRHPQEMILADLAGRCGCPVWYIERGPIPGTIQLDAQGILADTTIARADDWTWPSEEERRRWLAVTDDTEQHYRRQPATWWEQPNSIGPDRLCEKLDIPEDVLVVMFASQIDQDTQNLFFSPHFKNNLEGFDWFCRELKKARRPVFVLGKHHPKSLTPVEEYAAVMGDLPGTWTTDASLADCLAIADRVAAVNSTVIYEALMMRKPALSMGQGLLSGKGVAYEVTDLAAGGAVIADWLDGEGADARFERWRDFAAFLLSDCLYSMRPPSQSGGQRHAADFAGALAAAVTRDTPDYGRIAQGSALLDAAAAIAETPAPPPEPAVNFRIARRWLRQALARRARAVWRWLRHAGTPDPDR